MIANLGEWMVAGLWFAVLAGSVYVIIRASEHSRVDSIHGGVESIVDMPRSRGGGPGPGKKRIGT